MEDKVKNIKAKEREIKVVKSVVSELIETVGEPSPPEIKISKPKEVIKEEKRMVMICPFCRTKNYEMKGRLASTWCIACGKAFIVNWQEDDE